MKNSRILEFAQRDRVSRSEVMLSGEELFVWKTFLSVILETICLTTRWRAWHRALGRVFENGLRLADGTGALPSVVPLFALFHDAKRTHEGWEPGHGRRGAEYASRSRDSFFLDFMTCLISTL